VEHPTGWIRRLGGYVLRHRRDVGFALGAAILGSACQTVVPLLERHIVDDVIIQHTSSLWPWLVALIGLALATFGFAYLRRFRGGRVALEVQLDLRNDMQSHLQSLDFAALDQLPTGQVVARANSDSTLVQGLLSFLPIMSGNVLLMALSLIVMLVLSPLLAVVSLLVVPTLLAVSYRLRRQVFPATWDAQQREGDVAQIVDEDVNGVRVVKAFGRERRELERVAEAAGALYGSQLRVVRLQTRYQPLLQAIPSLGQVAILALGGYLVLQGRISLGTFLAFSTYVAQLVAPARQLAGLMAIGQQARASAERIFQLLDTGPAIVDAQDAIDLPAGAGSVEFTDVFFSYPGDGDPSDAGGPGVLRGFNLHIAAGERVAIVGPSGSGKTTAAALVSRFRDVRGGSVRVDGVDVRDLRLASLRRAVGVVFEEAFLFSETVKVNIAYGRPEATDEEIATAAAVAQADGFIAELPDGYDTVVGERGLTLSGGQRQRIALARAVLSDPRILVLDDATSALDAPTEEAINQGLRTVLEGRTTLLVAHRRSTLHLADRVVILAEGRILDEGTHDELFARSAFYRSLLSGGEAGDADPVADRVETLASAASVTGITESAWRRGGGAQRRFSARTVGAPSIGAGLGGGGGGWRRSLAPTPELIEAVSHLSPVRDVASIDLPREARRQQNFSLPLFLREFRRPLAVGLVLVVLDALAALAGPVLVKTGIDNGVAKASTGVLFAASAVYLVVVLADLVDEMGQTFVTGRAAQRIMLSLRIRIWAQLQRLSLDYYERELAGRIMTRMTTDVDQFESLVENGLLTALVSVVTFVGVGVALVVVNAELGVLTMTVVVPLAAATVVFRRRSMVLYDVARDRIAIVNADFQESLSGVRESQAFVHEGHSIRRFRRLGSDYLQARVAAQRLVATYFPFVQFLSAVADAVVLGVGAHLIATGHLTSGALIAFILYIDLFFSPIQQLSQVFDAWQQTRISVGRITQLMAEESLTVSSADAVQPGRLSGALALRAVDFAYPARAESRRKAPAALEAVDVSVRPGETVALVGATGAGKSTVMKLLLRFYDPDDGAVLADGVDIRDYDITGYRRNLGYVPQEAFLFTGTIRDNIAYGRPDATDAEVEEAAQAVGAHELVASLPRGYLQELSERGRSLSGGQRQLIALARAQLVDPSVLLLDEATSSLDLATEAKVTRAMERLARDRTTVIIAHRLQTARAADRIVVLDGGRVVEDGTHDQLRASGGRYARMWASFETLSVTHRVGDILDGLSVESGAQYPGKE
jgi:ATP-binding cassette subfamily B protein